MPNNQVSPAGFKACFVCGKWCDVSELTYNKKVHLPVCHKCKDTKQETDKEKEHLETLGDGFTVGCIS